MRVHFKTFNGAMLFRKKHFKKTQHIASNTAIPISENVSGQWVNWDVRLDILIDGIFVSDEGYMYPVLKITEVEKQW